MPMSVPPAAKISMLCTNSVYV